MEPLISVIIPMYNSEKFISRCLESVLLQDYKNIEIILIDDGSKDDTRIICARYEEQYSNIKYVYMDNSGVSVARNVGLRIANGEYIFFLDSDDYLENDLISFLYNNILENSSDLSICGYFNEKEGKKKIANNSKEMRVLDRDEAIQMLFDNNEYRGFLWNKLFKKSILINFDINFNGNITICEDLLFVFNYIINCNKIIYNPLPKYNYVFNENSALNNKKYDNKYYEKMLKNLNVFELMKACMESLSKTTQNIIVCNEVDAYLNLYIDLLRINLYNKELKNIKLKIQNGLLKYIVNKRIKLKRKTLALMIYLFPNTIYYTLKRIYLIT